MTCDKRIYAREVMEYTGKVMEAPLLLDDGTKLMEYEYLYKCCRCGSFLLWVPEQWTKENAVEVEQVKKHEQLYSNIARHNAYYHAKNQELESVTDVHKYHKRTNRLSKLSLLIGELELQYMRSLRKKWERT